MRENQRPTEVYMLRHKLSGKFYRRKWMSTPLVWTTKQGPSSAKGQIDADTRQDWHTVTFKVTNES